MVYPTTGGWTHPDSLLLRPSLRVSRAASQIKCSEEPQYLSSSTPWQKEAQP